MYQPPRQTQEVLDLKAALLVLDAPLAEVLAVVCEKSVAIFADAGERPTRHFCAGESRRRMDPDPDRPSQREARERNFLQRSSPQSAHSRFVVYDFAAPNIDAVMAEATARRNQVRAQWWLLVCHQETVTASESPDTIFVGFRSESIPQSYLHVGTPTMEAKRACYPGDRCFHWISHYGEACKRREF
jgi:hypothetical protein